MAENLEINPSSRPDTGDKSAAAKAGGKTVEAERRTFAEATDGARAAGEMARTAAEGGRRLAETSRSAAYEFGDLWRGALDPLPAVQMEMSRLFDEFWRSMAGLGGFPTMRASRPFSALGPAALFGQPPVDLKETDSAYLLAIETPGLTADDLSLSIDGDTLIVCGQKTEERDDASAAYRVSERRFGRFERRFPIALDVERERIEASYRDGVLRVNLPRRAEVAQTRSQIPIKR